MARDGLLAMRRAAVVVCAAFGCGGCEATVIVPDGGGWMSAVSPVLDPEPDRDRDHDRDEDDGDDERDGEGEASPACERFCAEAGAMGCPERGDCLAMCAEQTARSAGCTNELDALLACAPEHLAPPDQLDRYFVYGKCALTPFEPVPTERDERAAAPPPAFADCDAQVAAYDDCIATRTPPLQQFDGRCHVTSPFLTRVVGAPRTSEGDVPNAFETSYLRCPEGFPPRERLLKAWCDADGHCGCYADHELVGSCDTLLHVRGMVVAPASCCAPVFEDMLGM